MQKSYEYHSVTLSVKMRHAGDQFAKKTWQFFRVWSWFWYKILPEIIWKKGWSIFFKLAFEYQELRTHTTTQTYFKKNLWHWAPHESWNPPGSWKKNQKRPTLGLEESQHGYGESASTLSAGCGFRSCAGFVEENSAPFEGRTSWTICVFLVPKSLAFLAFLGGGCPMWRFFLRLKKNNRFKCWLSNLEFNGGPKWCELKVSEKYDPKENYTTKLLDTHPWSVFPNIGFLVLLKFLFWSVVSPRHHRNDILHNVPVDHSLHPAYMASPWGKPQINTGFSHGIALCLYIQGN